MACIDFPSGYFQALLSKDSQGYTAFNTMFGRFLFLRAPQGLSSSGDHFNSTTDQFFSELGESLIKQVDDIYILASILDELESRLEITAREAKKHSCTFTGRDTNIVSGYQVTLDPSGKTPPKIGPDPSRIEKLVQMQPPKNLKEVRSFLSLVNQMSKYASD